jgi:serine protease AprX
MTQIQQLMDNGLTGKGVTIGIVDTGIDIKHPDLKDMRIKAWKDYIHGSETPYDDNGHGTHVAGILAAKGSLFRFLLTGTWLKGIAPDSDYIIVKAIDETGVGSDTNIANGINFCVNYGTDIICLSLGGKKWYSFIGTKTEDACNNAMDAGIFIVAAAGNWGPDNSDVTTPASLQYMIAVGAVDKDRTIAPFSSKGDNGPGTLLKPERTDPNKKPELVAPGIDVLSDWLNARYAQASGTSQAVPFVVGTIALLLEAYPHYKHDSPSSGSLYTIMLFKNLLMETAKKCDDQTTPHDDYYGYGLVQAQRVYEGLVTT